MPLGLWPRRTVPTRRPVADEIRESVASSSLTTQTAPGVKAKPVGPFPTRVVATTVPWSGLISETVPSWPFATQTDPPPTTTASGARTHFDPVHDELLLRVDA